MSVAEGRAPAKRRDAPRIELAYGDFGLRTWGICFPQSVLALELHRQRGLSLMTDSQESRAMNSSEGREARGRTRGNWRPDVAGE